MVKDLLDYNEDDINKRNGYTVYPPNLGWFDSLFLVKTFTSCPELYVPSGFWRVNNALAVTIIDVTRKLKIKLRDSIKLLPSSLDKLLKSFECKINKGIFPHKFVFSYGRK